MLYNEIFTDEFLNKFGNYKDGISKLSLDDKSHEIDVDAIAEKCEVSLEYDCVESSGFTINNGMNSKNGKKVISINKFEPDYRQRFTIAHELGHIILGHEGISYRFSDTSNYKNTIARMNEVAANKFAAELIMPEKLVKLVLIDSIQELGFSIHQKFDENDINQLVDLSSNKMGVSTQALNYRIKNLGVFVDEK
ncbi:ImmA/IrrE family metallo-endopeptidase [Gardnerella swidsinskii]|uniref:ImmA/IrrE family metallo-endopeptidase n=1 Tax=Gardnerella TaxID=2701 RepID=UPI00200EE870|nr:MULTISPECIES: ImmA/IrrE family metallo-endopeptidase [Gardnerella]UQA87518.1 ImmA/IrrE family metallo-endopeptidase [Gardnerella vaginalis]UQA88662.1 ImmA/IrrE family metallo-endopeptidase [Gardnerella swidsinskii]